MDNSTLLLAINGDCERIVQEATRLLRAAGLSVTRTFDLQTARAGGSECTCPHHGTDQCDCQMVVLLVYADDSAPVSLVAHGQDGRCWLSLVDTPAQKVTLQQHARISRALADISALVVVR